MTAPERPSIPATDADVFIRMVALGGIWVLRGSAFVQTHVRGKVLGEFVAVEGV